MLIPLLPAGVACSGKADSGDPFVIGYVGDFSGDVGAYDRSGVAGARYEAARLNAHGGIDGRAIEIITEDIAGDPQRSADAAANLVRDGADVLLVPPLPELARGAVGFAAAAGVPALSVGGTIPTILEAGPGTTFLSAFGDNVQAAAAAEYAHDRNLRTAFTISSPQILDYSDTLPIYFADAFTHLGGEVLGTVDITLDAGGYRMAAQVIAALPAPPDVVYTATYPPNLASLLVELRRVGFHGLVLTADGSETAALFDAGDALGEVVLTAHAYSSENRLSGLLFSPRSPSEKIAEFSDGFERFHGSPPEILSFAALGADAVDIVHAAVEAADSTVAADIIDAIGSLDHVNVTTGRVTFDGQSGIPLKVVYLLRAEDGSFDLIKPIEPDWVPARLPSSLGIG
ncbi:MAG: ABC transporter substrate-binding protein [Ilumatobacteraceae bacterium]